MDLFEMRGYVRKRVVAVTELSGRRQVMRADCSAESNIVAAPGHLDSVSRYPGSLPFTLISKLRSRKRPCTARPRIASSIAGVDVVCARARSGDAESSSLPYDARISVPILAADMRVGDLVFIRAKAKPMREVAAATGSWTNHVGIVVDTGGSEPVIGESTFPLAGTVTLARFIARSEGGRVAVSRLKSPLTVDETQRLTAAAKGRAGIVYDTGFNLHSRRQFCSRYVSEVLAEATGVSVGVVETFGHLLERHPEADLGFWRLWYFGCIPWNRETVTPASLLQDREMTPVFDGVAVVDVAR